MTIGYRYFKTKVDKGIQVMLPLDIAFKESRLKDLFPDTYDSEAKRFIQPEGYIKNEPSLNVKIEPGEKLVRQRCWITMGFHGNIPSKYLSFNDLKDILSLEKTFGQGFIHVYSQVYFADELDWDELYQRTTTRGWQIFKDVPPLHELISEKLFSLFLDSWSGERNWYGRVMLDMYYETLKYDGIL